MDVNTPVNPDLGPFASWLRAAMQARGVSVRDLSRQTGLSHTAISEWTRGIRAPSLANVGKIALFFGVEGSKLVGLLPGQGQTAPQATPLPGALEVVLVPVVTQRAAAGTRGIEEVEYVPYAPPAGVSRSLYGLRIDGDSMEPEIRHGEVAIIDCAASPAIGDVIAARPNGEWLCKRIHRREGGTVYLRADNPDYAGEWAVDERAIIGVVVFVNRRINRRKDMP